MTNAFRRKIVLAVFLVAVVLLICALVYGLVWLLNPLSSVITAFATIVIAGYTWALRDSTNLLWKAGERHFELEGPFLHPIIQSDKAIVEALKFFSIYNHPTSPVTPVASEASFTIRNVGRSPALLKSVAVGMIILQVLDAGVGVAISDRMKTFGPAAIAVTNLAALVWLISR
jgi:hypothetical protein